MARIKRMRRYRTEILIGLVLLLATLGVYGNVSQNQFVDYDDTRYITHNDMVRAGLTRASIWWAFSKFYASNWHPLTWLSLQLDAQVFGIDRPWGFHLTNLLLHCANAVLLFVVLRAMTGAVWRSAAVAALFAWHPLHVESVAWAAERKDVLSTLFWMLTLGAYLLYVRRPGVGRYLAVVVCLLLGLLAKPMLVTLPCVLLLLDYWPLGRLRLGGRLPSRVKSTRPQATEGLGRLLSEKLPLFALAAGSCLVTWYAQRAGGAVQSLSRLPLEMRLANAVVACVGYLEKMVFPINLAVYYPHPRDSLTADQITGAGLFVIAATVFALVTVRRLPYFFVGWFWYVGTLVPVLGLVQVGNQAMADRYTYVPLIGVFIVLAWGLPDLLARWRLAEVVLVPVTAVFLGFCFWLTWLQVSFWQDSATLWHHAEEFTNGNAVAHNHLGAIYQMVQQMEEAEFHYREAIGIDSSDPSAYSNLGWLLLAQGKVKEAGEHFEAALQLDRNFGPSYNGLGHARVRQGNGEEAVADFRRAVELEPAMAQFHCDLAAALYNQGRPQEAQEEYRTATRLQPTWPKAAGRRAWTLATHPDPKLRNGREAEWLAKQVVQAGEGEPAEPLEVLAAAYAEEGRFEEAIATQRKALEKTPERSGESKGRQERLQLYEKRRPFREEPGGAGLGKPR
jgi:Flp pilus assembly protein TadD